MSDANKSEDPPGRPSLKERLLRGGFWILSGKVITAASTLVISALVTKLLPREAEAAYFLGDRLIWLVAMVSLLGANTAVVRLVAEAMGTGRPGRARGAVGLAFRLTLTGLAFVLALLLFGGGRWLALMVWRSEELASVIGVVAVWGAVHSLQILTSESFRGFQDLRMATLFGGVITGLLTVSVLGLAWATGRPITLREVMTVFVVSAGISLLSGLPVLRRQMKRLGPAESVPGREMLGISLPLWINGLFAWGLTQCDLLILGMFGSDEQIAVYGGAAKLVSLVLMSLMLVNLLVPPFVAELYARGERVRLERMLRLTATLAGLPAFGVLAVYLLFGSPLLAFVYEDAYRGGATILAILSVGRLVHVCTGSAAITLSMTGHQGALVRITLVTSVVTVGLAYLAGRQFGPVGIATAISAGVIVQNVSAWWAARRCTGMWTHIGIPGRDDLRRLFS